MSEGRKKALVGLVLEDTASLSLGELSYACAVHAETILALVDHGVLEPVRDPRRGWRFHGSSLARARRALALQRDLGVNVAGAALAVDLLDELDRLRARLRRYDPEL